MMKSISTSKDGKAMLKELSYTQYKDLVLQGGSHDNLFEVSQDESIGQIMLNALGQEE